MEGRKMNNMMICNVLYFFLNVSTEKNECRLLQEIHFSFKENVPLLILFVICVAACDIKSNLIPLFPHNTLSDTSHHNTRITLHIPIPAGPRSVSSLMDQSLIVSWQCSRV